MYASNITPNKRSTRTRARVARRFIATYGHRGSANLNGLTGKQARRYARALRGADMADFGRVFND
jgi:hypothetical protein